MSYFIKENFSKNDSLIKEVQGLQLLQKNLDTLEEIHIKLPKIYEHDKTHIKMEKIYQSNPTKLQSELLGLNLAKLHKIRQEKFGLDYDNYIGLNIQKNILCDDWGEFFYTYRLIFQVNIIKDISIKDKFLNLLEQNKSKLIDFLNSNTKYSSILHGDLWSGNILYAQENIYMIDPAVFYGDREIDIAMTEMFGGFSKEFYLSYNKELRLTKEYEKKKIIYNLYHYLNHYNLFGASYFSSCKKGVDFINLF